MLQACLRKAGQLTGLQIGLRGKRMWAGRSQWKLRLLETEMVLKKFSGTFQLHRENASGLLRMGKARMRAKGKSRMGRQRLLKFMQQKGLRWWMRVLQTLLWKFGRDKIGR